MSGIEAIGLISGVLTILDTINKLRQTIEDVHGLNPMLRQAADRLPLVDEILKTIKASIDRGGTDDIACSSMQPVLQSCSNKAHSLKDILQTVAVGANGHTPTSRRYVSAIRGLRKRQQAEELMEEMLNDVYLLIGNNMLRKSMEPRQEEKMDFRPSCTSMNACPSEKSNVGNFENQFNNFRGTQTNNFYGKQYIAETMNFY